MMNFVLKIFIGLSLILWSQGAYAAREGLYIGIDASYEVYDDTIMVNGITTNIVYPVDLEGVAPVIFAGYRQNRGWLSMAIEAQYGYAFSSDTVDPALTVFDGYKFSGGHAFTIALLPGFQVADDILFYARIGFVRSQFKEKITVGLLETTNAGYRSGFEYGVGIQLDLKQNVSIRAEYTRTRFKEFIINSIAGEGLRVDRNKFLIGILIAL